MKKVNNGRIIKEQYGPSSRKFPKSRSKSIRISTSTGSISAFTQFYEGGGRDYDEYCRWLTTLTDSERSSFTSVDSNSNEITEK